MEEQFSYDDILRIGEASARALQSPELNMSYRMTVDEVTRDMFNCEPHEKEKLMELRRQGNSLAKVFGRLQHWVAAAEAELAKQHQAKQGQDEYQGFGGQQ
jgi:hypothetical protein